MKIQLANDTDKYHLIQLMHKKAYEQYLSWQKKTALIKSKS